MTQSTPEEPDFPALPRLSHRVSTHTMVARVTALWHLEGKPQTPVSTRHEEGHCCYSTGGKRTCMCPLEMRPYSPVETPVEPLEPRQHRTLNLSVWPQLQRGLTTRHQLERNPESPLETRMEIGLSCVHTSGFLRSPTYLKRKLSQLVKNQEILPSRLDEALFCCSISREITPSHLNLEMVLQPLLQQKKFPDIPICTREENRWYCHNSIGAPFSTPQLEISVHFPASS